MSYFWGVDEKLLFYPGLFPFAGKQWRQSAAYIAAALYTYMYIGFTWKANLSAVKHELHFIRTEYLPERDDKLKEKEREYVKSIKYFQEIQM